MRGSKYTNDHYKKIARRYYQLMQQGKGISTIAIMSEELGVSRQKASNWVFRSKELGYLVRDKNAAWSSVKLGNGVRPAHGTSMTPDAIRKRKERSVAKKNRYTYAPSEPKFPEMLKVDDTPMPNVEVTRGLELVKNGDAYRLPAGLVVLATVDGEIRMLPTSAIVLI